MALLTADQQTQVRELLQTLVQIKSVNESREQADREQAEGQIADYVENDLRRIGMTVTRYPLAPGRDNLVAHWPDHAGESSFALQAHMDTVGVDQMTIDPFTAEIHDGRIWGRGTCDTKGALAAFLTALDIARRRSLKAIDNVHFVATVAEETGCVGAHALTDAGFHVDAVVVGEPTNSRLVTAHKGTYWARLEARGKSCHAARPHLGKNAIHAIAKAVDFIHNSYAPSLADNRHPLLDSPTLSVGTIQGGVATNVVPAACTAGLDFRILPAQTGSQVAADFLLRLRAAVPDEDFTLTEVLSQPGVETPPNSPWVGNLLTACQSQTGQANPEGVHYFADSGPFHAAGITCVLFGPGDIDQAHTAAEYLELEQLYLATQITLDWLECSASRSLLA